MFCYIDDNELYIIFPDSGRIFKVLRRDYDNPTIILEQILQYQADVIELIKTKNAISLKT